MVVVGRSKSELCPGRRIMSVKSSLGLVLYCYFNMPTVNKTYLILLKNAFWKFKICNPNAFFLYWLREIAIVFISNQIIMVLFVEFDFVCQFDLHDGVHFGLLKWYLFIKCTNAHINMKIWPKKNNMCVYGHPTHPIFQPPTLTFFIGNYSTLIFAIFFVGPSIFDNSS
jgi:hypothetical protein